MPIESPGMLAVARAKDLASEVLEQGLQELAIADRFDAAMSIDALENIPPEDWPTVLANLRRAIHPGGHLYLTVEEVDPAEIDAEFAALQATSAPAVHGEIVSGDTAGYHYYPGRSRVDVWLAEAGFSVVDEGENRADGYGYRHLLTRRD